MAPSRALRVLCTLAAVPPAAALSLGTVAPPLANGPALFEAGLGPLPSSASAEGVAVRRDDVAPWAEAQAQAMPQGIDASRRDSVRQFMQLAQEPGQAPILSPISTVEQCEMEAPGALCFTAASDDPDSEGFGQVVLPPAVPDGVVGYWPFDQSSPLDASGNNGHGLGHLNAGPSLGGHGSSAYFRRTFLQMPGAGAFSTSDFSYTFWIYLIPEGDLAAKRAPTPKGLVTGKPAACPVLRKGLDTRSQDFGRRFAAAPAVLLDLESRRLQIELATDTAGDGQGVPGGGAGMAETFQSNSRLKTGRWFHVALVRVDSEKLVRLYVNGVLDSTKRTKGSTRVNSEPLYVGGDPLTKDACDMPFYLDELKVYNRHATPDEIQAEASPALSGVEPHFVRLACADCTLEQAQESCPDEYHICDNLEMHLGGYQVARSLGWLEKGAHVWIHQAETMPGVPGSLQTPAPMPAPMPLLTPASLTASSPISFNGPPAPAPAGGPALGLGLCCIDPS
mmetsp:Transcript_60162/g.176538  ORF Transcript_60162/g.176538 Transcript_60162/m.176538 type:complete len:507 (+) Transcript_60162:85-1605(+)